MTEVLIFIFIFALLHYLYYKERQSTLKYMRKNIKPSKQETHDTRLTIKHVNTDARFVQALYHPVIHEKRRLNIASYNVIDFETANMYPDSICKISISEVVNNKIVGKYSYFVRPPYNDFRNTAINGISLDMVINAPIFSELWPEIEHFFEGKVIAAYNTNFDIGCLEDTLKYFKIPSPKYAFFDILESARERWWGWSDHKLVTISNLLNINQGDSDSATKAAKIQIAINNEFKGFDNDVRFKKMDKEVVDDIVFRSIGAKQLWIIGKEIADTVKSNSIDDYKLAIKYFDAAIEKGLEKSRLFRYYGEVLERCGHMDKAIECYEKAISLGDRLGLREKVKRLRGLK